MRREFFLLLSLWILLSVAAWFWLPGFLWTWIIVGPLALIGIRDTLVVRRTILRNFPVIGNFRYLFEMIRPEIQQYFIESDRDGVPFNREQRSVVYQRSKRELDTLPFGTREDVYRTGYEWVNHSMQPRHVEPQQMRLTIGGSACHRPYDASLLNISAMSFGALSARAVTALNRGAAAGRFAQNTGEGGISEWHRQGGDLIWQIGTGYFGCRREDGTFDGDRFREKAAAPEVKMIEIKISQGAKPGHGGILPGAKVTPEIAAIRGVPLGRDVLSPPAHSAFDTPRGLLEFVGRLRELSDGKPVGFKICVGKRREFLAICKAMVATGIQPDFIVVDGGEGGTGAAPLEFANYIGSPLKEALIFVHNALMGFGLRDSTRIIAAGRISSAFEIVTYLALGADLCYAARAFMLSLGCIQALRCNANDCPAGIATHRPELVRGLSVPHKEERVCTWHGETMEAVAEMIGAMGLGEHGELRPWHIMRRTGPNSVAHYGEIHRFLQEGELTGESLPPDWARAVLAASPDTFASVGAATSKTRLIPMG